MKRIIFIRPRLFLLAWSGCAGLLSAAYGGETPAPSGEEQKIVQLLNRVAFGPRPGDVERVEAMGMERYIQEQLHPENIPDAAVEKEIAPLDTLTMSSSHLLDGFYGDIKWYLKMQMEAGNGDDMKMRYGLDVPKPDKPAAQTRPAVPNLGELAARDSIRAMGELQQAKLMRAVDSDRQLQEVLVDFWSNHFNVDMRKNQCRVFLPAYDRETIRPNVLGRFRDLLGAVAHSPAMLVYLDNNENAAVRERSKVEQALIEIYVNYKFGMKVGAIPNKEGPNENYGRELLELHTLGVDGGYTQKDVQEVARCFSGWSFSPFSAKFDFTKNRHDDGEKVVLGQTILAGGGVADGERVLDILAKHPATAKFISHKLCQRFVADEPPAALVDRVTKVFTATDGDLRKVVETIVASDEFFSAASEKSKIKSPFEYAVSAMRATGGELTSRGWGIFGKLSYVQEGGALLGNDQALSKEKKKTLNWHVHDMGEPLFAHAAPTGYSEVSKKWVSSGALIDRLNFATALTDQDVKDASLDLHKMLGDSVDADDACAVVDRFSQVLLHRPLSDATKKVVIHSLVGDKAEAKTIDVKKAAALILGSPEFQRR